jgi:2-hydroxychromene-2-carboxylate isomerase
MSDADITFWFDPSCPFAWCTSRWLVDVAQRHGLRIHWRLMSLTIVNKGKVIPQQHQEAMAQGVRVGRLLHAVGEQRGQDALARLYTEIGERVRWPVWTINSEVLAEALEAAGLDAGLLNAADDTSLDAEMRASHDAGQARMGTKSGSPIVAFGDGPGFFGPVVSPVPEAERAEMLYDAMRLLSAVPEFSEIKRSRAPF